MPNWEALKEAERRGILPPDKQKAFNAAKLKGLVPGGGVSGSWAESPDETLSWKDALSTAFKNIPESAWGTAKSFVTPFIHPVKTAKTLGRIGLGAVEKIPGGKYLIPGPDYELKGQRSRAEDFDRMVGFFKDRYGSVENFKKAVSEDPIGIAADIATVLIPVGKGMKTAGEISKIGSIGKIGETVSRIGATIEPFNAAKLPLKAMGKLIPKRIPYKLYQSAVKFSTVLTNEQRAILTETALKSNILPTVKGIEKTRILINDLNLGVEDLINQAQRVGEKIPLQKLFDGFDELRQRILETSGDPIGSARKIDRIQNSILTANAKLNRTELTPIQAQRIKQRIYRELENEYSRITLHPISKEAQMLVAKNAKEALEQLVPEVKKLNATEGSLIELRKVLERSTARIRNRDILGIGLPIKTVAGATMGGTGEVAGLLWGILDTPLVKSKLALVANDLKNKGILVKPTAAAIRLGLVQSGRVENMKD